MSSSPRNHICTSSSAVCSSDSWLDSSEQMVREVAAKGSSTIRKSRELSPESRVSPSEAEPSSLGCFRAPAVIFESDGYIELQALNRCSLVTSSRSDARLVPHKKAKNIQDSHQRIKKPPNRAAKDPEIMKYLLYSSCYWHGPALYCTFSCRS